MATRVMIVLLAVLACAPVPARGQSTPQDTFRVESETGHSPRGFAVSGYVYNDGAYRVSNVRLSIEVLDEAGRVVERGSGWVYGDIPERGRAYFHVPVPARGASYRVGVESFNRVSAGQ